MSGWPSGTSTFSILPPNMPHERQHASQHIVGLELGKSSVVKQRKLRSKVWEDFEKYKDENGKDWARCKVCEKKFDGSSKLGTTHLRNHFRSCQRKRNGDGGGDEPPNLADNLSNPIAIQGKYVIDQQLNHLDAARMIIKQGDASLINSTNVGYIIDVYKEEKEKLHNYFEKSSRRLCLTIKDEIPWHTCLTVWFVDDDDWKLKNKVIGFLNSEDVEIIVEYIKKVLLEWGSENNLSSVVTDNNLYEMIYDKIGEDWFSTQALLFNSKLLCNGLFSYWCDALDNILIDVITDTLYESLKRFFDDIRYPSSKNENFRNAIDVAIKSLGKEVTVQLIPTYQELMQKFWRGEKSEILGVLKNVLSLKETFFNLGNSHPDFQNLTKEEWDVLRAIYEYFEDYGDFLLQCNTANTRFPLLCRIYKLFKELRKCGIHDFRFIERMDNYWCKCNLDLAVASVLDPRFRMDIVKNWYKKIFGDEWKPEFTKFTDYFTNIYHEYARGINNCTSGLEENNASFSYKMLDPLGKLCKSSQEGDHVQWLTPELRLYFEEVKFPSIKDFDILEWWRVHARYFPTLARMARDFLSIQISCPPVRVSFSHNEMVCIDALDFDGMDSVAELDIKEAYICTKSWLREEL